MVRQTGQRLKEHGEAVELVPKRENDTDLFDIVTRRVSLEKIRLASFLLLNIELRFFAHGVRDEGLHEALRIYLQ